MNLANIVTVNISLATVQVTGIAFGRAMFYGHSNRFTAQTAKVYQASSWQAAMLADGFQTSDLEYIMAGAYFSQVPSPPDVMIAQLAANVAQVETVTPVYADNTTYTVTINGVISSYATTTGGSATTIVTGLKAAIAAQSPALPVVTSGSTTLILTSATAGQLFTIAVGAGSTVVHTTANLGPQENMAALVSKGYGQFYGIGLAVTTGELSVDNRQMAIWNEAAAIRHQFIGTSNAAASYDGSSTTDDMYVFKAASYGRSTIIYDNSPSPGTHAAAWFGAGLSGVPGSKNWGYMGLVGETADPLTDAQTVAINAKNGNYYVNVSGSSFAFPGVEPNGSFIDITFGNDWVANTIQVNLATLFLTQAKVPFDDGGIAQIGGVIQGVLDQAVLNGIYTRQPKPVLTLPRASSFTPTQRQTRNLTGVSWTAQQAGAVDSVTVNANLTF